MIKYDGESDYKHGSEEKNVYILGAGSNTLFRDSGFDGVIIKLGKTFAYTNLLEDNKIEVEESDLKKAIEEEIMRQPDAKDRIIKFYTENSQALASLKAPIFEQKVVDYILANIKIEKKKISKKELLKK